MKAQSPEQICNHQLKPIRAGLTSTRKKDSALGFHFKNASQGSPWWSSGQYAVLPLQEGMGFIPGHTHGVAKNQKKKKGYKPSEKLFNMGLKDLVELGIQAVIKE